MTKKEKFYLQAQKFFEEGILKEIYTTDNISLCNVGNAYYAAFLVGDTYRENNIQFMLLSDDQIEFIMQNDDNLSRLYRARPTNQKMLYVFDERAYNTMNNSRNRILVEGPAVDLENEARLIEKYSSKNKSR